MVGTRPLWTRGETPLYQRIITMGGCGFSYINSYLNTICFSATTGGSDYGSGRGGVNENFTSSEPYFNNFSDQGGSSNVGYGGGGSAGESNAFIISLIWLFVCWTFCLVFVTQHTSLYLKSISLN